MRPTDTTVGFVGLGHMGGGMTRRLLDAGHAVHGTARTREHAQDLIDAGLIWHDEPREVAVAVDVVFSSLPDDRAVESAAMGADGILAGLDRATTWLDMSTTSPRMARNLAARARMRQSAMLDAPVSGSVPQTRDGTLTIMVGGDPRAYARVEPILRELGTPTLVGDSGHGQVLKLAINLSLAVQMVALAEGLLLAERAGLDTRVALEVMTSSAIGSPVLKARAPLVLDLPDDAWFAISLMRKDVELALAAGNEVGVPLRTASSADDVLTAAHDIGYDDRDIAALLDVLRRTVPRDELAA
jgi:3-hydroxyisobutyrate dehydrogenase-like beta-hydroxyacid dehydrogenase